VPSSITAVPPTTAAAKGKIVFYSERDGNAEIYTMNPDGSDQRRLTFNQFEDVAPVWSPDGSQIAFLSNRDDPNPQSCFPECFYQIYISNADGSDERKLVGTEFSTHHPDWHPDGTKLSFDTEFGLQGDIYTVNADGSDLQLLIEDGFWADWSPDRSQIVFASNQDGELDLYIADANGSDQRRITDDPEMNVFPAWSPDGEKIAYAVIGSNFQNQDIFLINLDGSERVQVTDERRIVDEDPAWSPDGSQFVFQSNRDGNFEIYIMNADGTGQQRLTTSPAGDYWPAWGPSSHNLGE
jgi:TolB protein